MKKRHIMIVSIIGVLLCVAIAIFVIMVRKNTRIEAKPVDGIELLWDEGLDHYNIQPCIIEDGNIRYIYYTVNKTEKKKDSSIAVRKATKTKEGWKYEKKKIVLEPSESGWDCGVICNAEVIKGTFKQNEETYKYLMAYQGNAEVNSDKNYQIGFAVANDPTGPFVRVDDNPVVAYDSIVRGVAWGIGQPTMFSHTTSSGGQFTLAYTIGEELHTYTVFAEIDASNLEDIKGIENISMLPLTGLKDGSVGEIMMNDIDLALDRETETLYMVRNFNPESAAAPRLATAVQICKIPYGDIYSVNAEWTILEEKLNFLDLSTEEKEGWERVYSGCIVKDFYGTKATATEIGFSVTSYDPDTREYLYYQGITAKVLD